MGDPSSRELWLVRAGTVPYRRAWAWQRALVERRAAGEVPDTVLLLEHPHVYTIGKRGSDGDVLVDAAWLAAQGAEVVRTDRGGQVTYHGPGQLVGYPITLLDQHPDVWRFIRRVEDAMVDVAAGFGLQARGERGLLTGVWVGDAKLVAIGMRGSRGGASHRFALHCAAADRADLRPQAGLAQGEGLLRPQLPRAQGADARRRAAHRLRGGGLPQH